MKIRKDMRNKIISGKTILLNTRTNCTFIASDLDEEVQTGTRENDGHIEWTGELDIASCEHQFQPISKILWGLLDDIDSASDVFKPSSEKGYKSFYEYALNKSANRHKYLRSDGYKLELNDSPEPDLTRLKE